METVTLTKDELKELMSEAGMRAIELDLMACLNTNANKGAHSIKLIQASVASIIGQRIAERVFAEMS